MKALSELCVEYVMHITSSLVAFIKSILLLLCSTYVVVILSVQVKKSMRSGYDHSRLTAPTMKKHGSSSHKGIVAFFVDIKKTTRIKCVQISF